MIFKLFAILLFGLADAQKRVKLKNVDVLTLYAGKMTTGRRSAPLPQLQCVGGSAGCSAFVPTVVQCYNRGSDGIDIQWECKADMQMKYKFGQVQVTCEGFDYADDPYVLAGSCGLEYTIDRAGSSSSYSSNGGTSFWSSSNDDSSEEGSWALFIIIGFVIYLLVTNLNSTTEDRPPPYNPDFIPPAGTNPSSNAGWFSGSGRNRASSNSNDGPGFGTGFAAGAATGFAAGNAHARSNRRRNWFGQNSWFGGNSWTSSNNSYSQGFNDGRRSSPSRRRSPSPAATKTASGFGGTKRR